MDPLIKTFQLHLKDIIKDIIKARQEPNPIGIYSVNTSKLFYKASSTKYLA